MKPKDDNPSKYTVEGFGHLLSNFMWQEKKNLRVQNKSMFQRQQQSKVQMGTFW